jgi:hypothetical protein
MGRDHAGQDPSTPQGVLRVHQRTLGGQPQRGTTRRSRESTQRRRRCRRSQGHRRHPRSYARRAKRSFLLLPDTSPRDEASRGRGPFRDDDQPAREAPGPRSAPSRHGHPAGIDGQRVRLEAFHGLRPCRSTRRGCARFSAGHNPASRAPLRERGLRKSPQTLSRGNVALSRSSTRQPARATPTAAALPAGPAPTTRTS